MASVDGVGGQADERLEGALKPARGSPGSAPPLALTQFDEDRSGPRENWQ